MAVLKVPSEFPTINVALAAAEPFDTIRVAKGIFPEAITINKNGIRLIGAGKGKTFIDGQGAATSGIIINAILVAIEDLTVQNFSGGSGIEMNDELNIIHKVQVLNNGEHGIKITRTINILMQCEINENVGDGIHVGNDNNNIIQCKMIYNENGVFIESSRDNNLITCCLAENNRQDGFHVSGRESYIISNAALYNGGDGFGGNGNTNIFLSNKSNNNKGNGFTNGSSITLCDNISKANESNGIVMTGNFTKMIKNQIINNKNNGIFVKNTDNIIDQNIVKNSALAGIRIAGDDTAVRSNCLKGNSPDIFVEDMVEDCTFADNDCETSTPLGLCERNDAIDVQEGETIQQAIDDAPDGFQINIGDGVFNEAVIVDKDRLRIVGADMWKTIIDGTNIVENGILLNSKLSSIENLTVQNFVLSGVNINDEFNTLERVQSNSNREHGFNISADLKLNLLNECKASMSKKIGFNSPQGDLTYFIKCHADGNRGKGFIVDAHNLLLFNEAKNNGHHGIQLDFINKCIENYSFKNKGNGFVITNIRNLLFNNRAIKNKKNGILVPEEDSSIIILWENICNKNEGDGIELNNIDNIVNKNCCQRNKENGIQMNQSFEPEIQTIIDDNCIENNLGAGIVIEETDTDFFGIRSNCLLGNNPDIQNNSLEVDNIAIDENKCNSSIPDGLCEGSCGTKKLFKR
ncbi:right-handed parallel beta-helix repeat-containing protein [Chengkuizengella sp. SCS-71B]|uniref:right-handed parallel beta-helix repeat-containing protein n=1 Tax=Chengkuizengella sp. SCS-71B TaxID=3115290 RepID=UPI0032C22DFF